MEKILFYHDSPLNFFLSHSAKKIRRVTLQCFRKFRVSKNFMDIKIFRRKISVSQHRIISWGTLPGFRKNLVSKIFMHKKGVITIFHRINKGKNVGKSWDSNPYRPLQNPVVLPTAPWEQLEILTNVSEFIKISDTKKIWTRTYCLRNFDPNPTADVFLRKKVGKVGLKKRKMTILQEKIFSHIYQYAAIKN